MDLRRLLSSFSLFSDLESLSGKGNSDQSRDGDDAKEPSSLILPLPLFVAPLPPFFSSSPFLSIQPEMRTRKKGKRRSYSVAPFVRSFAHKASLHCLFLLPLRLLVETRVGILLLHTFVRSFVHHTLLLCKLLRRWHTLK